jgi:hypothetical protein
MSYCLCLGHMNLPLSNPYYMGVVPMTANVSQSGENTLRNPFLGVTLEVFLASL